MRYRYLGETSIQVSVLCLGTMMFGGQTSEAESLPIMDYAFDNGVNFFDTSNNYNEGESEKITGKGLRGRRDKIILATKVRGQMGNNPNDSGLNRRNIVNAVNASLKRLDTDYIDIYYMHQPDYGTNIEESLEAMSALVRDGKIRYIGISNYAAWQIADMLAVCDKRNYIAPIITQNVYNLITRGIESELVPFIKTHKLGLSVYNPLGAGLLTGKHKPGKPAENTRFANNQVYYERYWSAENFNAVEKLEKIAGKCGITMPQLAMKWCLTRDYVTTVISGVSRKEQIVENIRALEGDSLPEEAVSGCEEVWRQLIGTRIAYNR